MNNNNNIDRKDIWIQSKFVPILGHNENIPYDKNNSLWDQVNLSFMSVNNNYKVIT
eukprot:UN20544